MIIHGKEILEDFNTLEANQIQPNAIDFTIDEMYEFSIPQYLVDAENDQRFEILKTATVHSTREKRRLAPKEYTTFTESPKGWFIGEGRAYPFESSMKVVVPEGMVAWIITRSSLNRNGVFLQAGLYDSGYSGTIGGTIYCMNPRGGFIECGARIGQIIFATAEARHLYDGQYQSRT